MTVPRQVKHRLDRVRHGLHRTQVEKTGQPLNGVKCPENSVDGVGILRILLES